MRLSRNLWPITENIPPVKHKSSYTASVNQTLSSCEGHQNWDTKPSQALPTESCALVSVSRNLFPFSPILHHLTTYSAAQLSETCPMAEPSIAVIEHTLGRCRSQKLPPPSTGKSIITGHLLQLLHQHCRACLCSRAKHLPCLTDLSRNIYSTYASVCSIVWHRYKLLAIYLKMLYLMWNCTQYLYE